MGYLIPGLPLRFPSLCGPGLPVIATICALFLASDLGTARGAAIEYFPETIKDFGTTPKGPVLIHYFTIKNTSKNTVTMGTPRIQCGCVSVNLAKATLAPGEETTLIALMDTKKIPTQQLNVTKSVAVYVPFISPIYEEVTLKVVTVCRDDLFLSPDSLRLGDVSKGKTPSSSVKLTMFTQPNWDIKEVKSTGAYVDASVKLVKRQGSEVTFEVTATLDKECPVGNWMSDVIISSNVAGLEKFRVPVTVNVVASPANTTSPLASTIAVKFGDVTLGSTPSKEVTLEAAEPFKILEMKGDSNLTVTAITNGTQKTHKLKVEIDAKTAGEFTRKVEVRTDSKTMSTATIPVTAKIKK
jgi:hypothetical protein